jgi:hypothetical protein
MDVKEKVSEPVDDASSSDAKLTVNFTVWYYLCLACFLIAAFFNYNKRKSLALHEVPPKKAPQLPLENPGDQSDFPKSASESEIG